jgi:hypothetical protein
MSNAQKTPFYKSLNEFATSRVRGAIDLLGKSLPATVTQVLIGCVQVKFELTNIPFTLPKVTVPIGGAGGSEFIRLPIQVGTKGWVQAADARLGGMSGLGASTADLTAPANLSALVFEPIGNKSWSAMEDTSQLELMGFDGVLIKSTKNKEWYARWTTTGVTISNNAGTAQITWNGTAWEFKGPALFDGLVTASAGLALAGNITAPGGGVYTGAIHTTGTIKGDGGVSNATIDLSTHHHSQSGGGSTGPALP